MSLKNIRIAPKIAAIVVILSAIGLAGSIFLAQMMSRMDARYSELLDRRGVGNVMLALTAARVLELDLYGYHTLVYPGTSPQAKAAAETYKRALELARKNLDDAAKLMPEVTEIASFKLQIDAIDKIGQRAVEAGLRDNDAVAKAALAEMDPLVREISKQLKATFETIRAKTQAESDLMSANVETAYYATVATGIAVTVLAIALALLVSTKGITGPLVRLQGRMRSLADGQLDVDVEGQDRRDEIGGMAKTVQVFKDNALRAQALEQEAARMNQQAAEESGRNEQVRTRLAKEQADVVASLAQGLTRLSGGDLTYRLSEAFAEDYEKLRADFNAAIAQLQDTMKIVAGNTAGIHSGSGEISQAADNLSKRTEQQAASLEETAAALDEITATVKKTAAGADHARGVVASAKTDADRSAEVVRSAVSAMSEIEKSSQQISQIIGVIDEIAFQTNLLALNAGVEAARAGEAGKGFAVVASEVRALAQRSADAAKEIKGLISASGTQVSLGVQLVGETGQALARIATQVADINAIVSEIAASAQEQATGLDQVNVAVNQMDQVTQQNAAMVEESTAASHSLVHEATELSSLIGRFQIGGLEEAVAAPARTARPAARAPAPRAAGGRAPSAPRLATSGNLALQPSVHTAAEESWEEF